MNYFIFGQIGIVTAVIFSMAIVQIQARMPVRPPWYYFIAVWSVALAATFMFSSAYTYPGQDKLPDSIYVFRFVLGCERILAWYWLKYRTATTLPITVISRTNHVLSIVSVLVILTSLGYGTIYTKLQANSAAIQKLGRVATVLPDTARIAQLQADNDTLKAQLSMLQQASVIRERQINALQAKIIDLTDLIVSLKTLIRSVGANVERTRRADIDIPGPIRPNPPTYVLPIPRAPVAPPTTPTRRRKQVDLTPPWHWPTQHEADSVGQLARGRGYESEN